MVFGVCAPLVYWMHDLHSVYSIVELKNNIIKWPGMSWREHWHFDIIVLEMMAIWTVTVQQCFGEYAFKAQKWVQIRITYSTIHSFEVAKTR